MTKKRGFLPIYGCFFITLLTFALPSRASKLILESSTTTPDEFAHLKFLWQRSSENLTDTACGSGITNELLHLFTTHPQLSRPLPTLTGLTDLLAKDGRLRLITWTHNLPSGETLYKGVVAHLDINDSLHLTQLRDRMLPVGAGHISEEWFNSPASPDRWFGAIYYEVEPFEFQGTPAYLLLGVAGHTSLCTRKVIETLYIDATGDLQFGLACLSYSPRRTFHRIFYSYSARAGMTLHFIKDGTQVLIDHLSPSAPQYSGLPQFYGPDASQDVFTRSEVGYWRHETDVVIAAPTNSEPTPSTLHYQKGY